MSKRIGETQTMFRDERTGKIVFEYRGSLGDTGDLSVRLPARLGREQAEEAVEHLRSLAYDLEREAGFDNFGEEESARAELFSNIRDLRAASAPITMEDAQGSLAAYAQFRDAVAEYLRGVARTR